MEAGGERILVDCGSGTIGALASFDLDWQGVSHVLLTHFHTDHVADLAPLLLALKQGGDQERTDPLTLLGPEGLHGHLDALSLAHGAWVADPGFPLIVEELPRSGSWGAPGGTLLLRSYPTNHTKNSLALRLETEDGAIGFTGDTGPDSKLGVFMKGVRILLAECSHSDGQGMDTHLTPSGLMEVASAATPELLVNVHAYPPLDPEKVPVLLEEKGYGGRVVSGWDGMEILVSAMDVRVEEKGA